MPVLRLFAGAREAAGTGRDLVPGATVAEVLEEARMRYGAAFADVLRTCRVWVDGEPATDEDPVAEGAEVAVLPPVSGGCGRAAAPRP
jgi:molybdopterin converting factor small subunit